MKRKITLLTMTMFLGSLWCGQTWAKEVSGTTLSDYEISQEMSIMRYDERILSLKEEHFEYHEGGAYPTISVRGINYDVSTGEELVLEDILADPEVFETAAVKFIIGYMQAVYDTYGLEVTEEQIRNYWETDLEWYINASGINLIFNEGIIGPHAVGVIEIPMTLAEGESYIKPEYRNFETAGVYAVQENIPLIVKNEEEAFSLMLNVEEQGYDLIYSVLSGTNTVDLGHLGYFKDAYYVKKTDGKDYLMFDFDMASEDYTTYLLDVGKDGATKMDTLFSAIDSSFIRSDKFDMEYCVNMLGSYGSEKTYYIDENGMFVTDETEYRLKGDVEDRYELKTVTEIPVIIDGTETILPAGTGLRVIGTDDETYVRVQISETCQMGELKVRRDEEMSWRIYIGDVSAENCFEMLPYAG